VDILRVIVIEKLGSVTLRGTTQLLETAGHLFEFCVRQHTGNMDSTGVGKGGTQVNIKKPQVEIERAIELRKGRIGIGGETPAPELLGRGHGFAD
jgi:hypothetical protein